MNLLAFPPEKTDNPDTVFQGLADVHCHCADASATEEMLQRAHQRGIQRIILTGTKPADFEAVRQFGRKSPVETRTAFGIHPWEAVRLDEEREEEILSLLDSYWKNTSGKFRAGIGEIGLDFALRNLNAERKNRQRRWFDLQLDRAARTGQPVIIHAVNAVGGVIRQLEEKGPFRLILMHQFCARAEDVRRLAAMGAYFSFHLPPLGNLPAKWEETIRSVPEERLLLESDWPGGGTEPCRIPHSIPRLAAVRKTGTDAVMTVLQKNARQFFTEWDKP